MTTISPIKNTLIFTAVALGLGLAFTSSAAITSLNWGAGAQDITADTDVLTSGTLVAAFNIGPAGVAAATVNGVVFSPFAFPADGSGVTTVTQGNYQFTETTLSRFVVSTNGTGSTAAPFTTLSSGYQTLLSSAGGASDQNTLALTMSGLTAGQPYLFEFWANNSSGSAALFAGSFPVDTVTATAGNSVTLDTNTTTTNVAGGRGQYAVGTFTPAGTTFTVGFDGGTSSQFPIINAFQLRVIPEPSTFGLLAVGAALAATRCRRRQTQAEEASRNTRNA